MLGKTKRKKWEAALLMGLAALLLTGAYLDREQGALAERVIRLHVIASSDSDEDQALKLAVRDRVLARAEELYEPGDRLPDALARLTAHLDELRAAGQEAVREAGRDDAVTASIERVWFPTKEYRDFALPAGTYTALRVVIGEGEGRNWWCVVFPPLCLGSVSERTQETAAAAGLTDGQIALITGRSEGYAVKFRAIELWETLKAAAGKAE